MLLTVVGVIAFLRAESLQRHKQELEELRAVSTHIADEISSSCEHVALAVQLVADDPRLAAAAERVALGEAGAEDQRLVSERLGALAQTPGVIGACLADARGRALLATGNVETGPSFALTEAVRTLLASGEAGMSDLHAHPDSKRPGFHVNFIAPLAPISSSGRRAAAIVANVDAESFLYPAVTAWPGTERTGEALLLRRAVDGSVLISSPLRLADDPPLSRSIAATATTVEVRAFHTPDAIIDGTDYRGQRVLAHAKPVAGTPWVLLAKVDRSEALAAWRTDEFAILVALAFAELSIVGSAAYGWTRWSAAQRKRDADRLTAVLGVLHSRPASARELLVRLVREVMVASGSTAAAVYRYHRDTDELSVDVRLSESLAQPGPVLAAASQRLPASALPTWAEPLRTGSPLIVNEDAAGVLAEHGYPERHPPIHTMLVVPIVLDDEPVAVVGLANKPDGYDERDAAEVAMAFEAAWHEVDRLALLEALETRVEERTQELAEANEELQAQSEELAAANEELLAANDELNTANAELARQAEELAEQASELEMRTRELAEANAAKTKFLRTMSHELRTPLNSVIGFTQLMLQGLSGPLTDEQRKQLEMVNASGHHLLSLVNDLLDLSRIEAGAVEYEREPVDVAALAAEVVDSVRAVADAKGLALEMEVPDPAPRLVSDCKRVRQILLNLLSNAVKYTERGGVRLIVSADGHRTVSFAVSDTGPGIPADDLGRIFDEFVQLGERTQGNGTGLGLPIARHLAIALGGSLTVRSEVGVGSTFTLTLPQE